MDTDTKREMYKQIGNKLIIKNDPFKQPQITMDEKLILKHSAYENDEENQDDI